MGCETVWAIRTLFPAVYNRSSGFPLIVIQWIEQRKEEIMKWKSPRVVVRTVWVSGSSKLETE